MQRAHDLVDNGAFENGAVIREVRRAAWSPAQLIDVAAGVLLVVLGGVGLARAGTNFSDLTYAHSQVIGLGVTPLSAVAELVAGVLLLAGAAYAASSKAMSSFVGVVMLAFGLVVALDQAPFHRAWDFGRPNGIACAIAGAVLLLSSIASPVFSSRRRIVVHHSAQPASPDPLQSD